MGKSNATKGIVAIIVIIVAGFVLLNMKFHWVDLKFLGGRQNPADPTVRPVIAIDVMDGKMYEVTLNEKKNEKFPLINPNTKTKTLWQAYVCREEKIIFPVPNMPVMSCPFCAQNGINNPNVGAATEAEKDYPVKIFEGWRDRFIE